MRLPNKLYSYQESQLPLFPVFIDALSRGVVHPVDLFDTLKPVCQSVSDFTEVLDALYALGIVAINKESGVLSLVD